MNVDSNCLTFNHTLVMVSLLIPPAKLFFAYHIKNLGDRRGRGVLGCNV